MTDTNKIFLVFNLSYFGDVLLSNSLCQNLKKEYPDCKVVFVCNTPFYEAAKYQEGVDDVLCMNKRKEHKGLLGLLKFVYSCKYRNRISAAFILYGNSRGILTSFFLNSKERISGPTKYVKHLLTKIWIDKPSLIKMQDINGSFIEALTGKETNALPIKYNISPMDNLLAAKLKSDYKEKNIIGLCCISKDKEKDMPIVSAIEIINKLNEENKTVFLFGNGNASREYADNLKKHGCTKFVDLTNVTSIYDLANILSICKATISVDTGTMHLSYAIDCPTLCLFYKKSNVGRWAPDSKLYNVYVESDDFSVENICNKLNNLINKHK